MGAYRITSDFTTWDKFLKSQDNAWLCDTGIWKNVIELSFPHISGKVVLKEDEKTGTVLGGMPIYFIKSKLLGNRIVHVPFSSVNRPFIIDSNDFSDMLNCIKENRGNASIEVRTCKLNMPESLAGFTGSTTTCQHLLDLQRPLSEIRARFHNKCIKTKLLKLEAMDIELQQGKDENAVNKFYNLHLITRRRLGLPPQPLAFYQNMWKVLYPMGHVDVLFAMHKKEFIGTLWNLKYNKTYSLEFIGSTDDANKKYVAQFLYWEAIKKAKEEGFRYTTFARTSKSNASLLEFKERWGTQTCDYVDYHFPQYFSPKKNKFTGAIRIIASKLPLPIFKLLGEFCYRHMG